MPFFVDQEKQSRNRLPFLTIATFKNLTADPRLGRAGALRLAMLAYLNDTWMPVMPILHTGDRSKSWAKARPERMADLHRHRRAPRSSEVH